MSEQQSYQHWSLHFDEHHSAWLSLDKADSSANTMDQAVLDELETILNELNRGHQPNALVIRSNKKSGFIAGADIKYFRDFDKETAIRFIRQGQKVYQMIEDLPYPTIALIHGFCLGGGMELALACRYRIADNDPKTRLGLPEVMLGIQPGWGGTIRMPRLIGTLKALELILSGRSLTAKAAYKLGLVDAQVPKRILHETVAYFIQHQPPRRQANTWLERLVKMPFMRIWVAKYLHQKLARRISASNYPAPFRVIDNWQEFGGEGARAYAAEVDSISYLLSLNSTQELVRVFFLQEQLKALGRSQAVKAQRLHVIGAGVMGGDIAAWGALKGLLVTVQDQNVNAIAATFQRARTLFSKQLKEPHLVQAALDRLLADPSGFGIKHADVIIEAIVEKADVKQNLFVELEQKAKKDAILASNTSTIPLSEIGKNMNEPGRVLGIHFFNPVAKMRLVEVVYDVNTLPEAKDAALSFVAQIDKLPLPVKSSPGFLVNRILMPYIMESVLLYEEGVPAVVIDKAAVKFGMPMGPLELADTVGLDVCLLAAGSLQQYYGGVVPQKFKFLVDSHLLGRKTGQGFYKYVNGKVVRPAVPRDYRAQEDLADRLFLRMVNEAVACLREGVVEQADWLDAGLILGTGFPPYLGGPMQYIRQYGHAALTKRLSELHSRYGERFALDAGWEKLA